MNRESSTASNTPSEPLLCEMGCGFFVSSIWITFVSLIACFLAYFYSRWKRVERNGIFVSSYGNETCKAEGYNSIRIAWFHKYAWSNGDTDPCIKASESISFQNRTCRILSFGRCASAQNSYREKKIYTDWHPIDADDFIQHPFPFLTFLICSLSPRLSLFVLLFYEW